MEDREIIREIKLVAKEVGDIRYEMARDRQRIAKLEGVVKRLLRRS